MDYGVVMLVEVQGRADHLALQGGGVVPLEFHQMVWWVEVGEKNAFTCDPHNGYLAVSSVSFANTCFRA